MFNTVVHIGLGVVGYYYWWVAVGAVGYQVIQGGTNMYKDIAEVAFGYLIPWLLPKNINQLFSEAGTAL